MNDNTSKQAKMTIKVNREYKHRQIKDTKFKVIKVLGSEVRLEYYWFLEGSKVLKRNSISSHNFLNFFEELN